HRSTHRLRLSVLDKRRIRRSHRGTGRPNAVVRRVQVATGGRELGVLTRLVEVSIRFRGIVVALACLVVGYGVYATWSARYDVYPEFAPPQVVVQTEAPGLSAEDVEQLVTRPVENALNGVADVEAIR